MSTCGEPERWVDFAVFAKPPSEELGYTYPALSAFIQHNPFDEAALAPFDSHPSPIFETSSSLSIPYYPAHLKISPKRSLRPWLSSPQLLSFVFLSLVLLLQVFLPSPVLIGFISPRLLRHGAGVDSPAVCPNTPIFAEPLPTARPFKMALLEEARKVAAEFKYPSEEVNKGVKAFIQQMSSCALRRSWIGH